MKRAAIAIACIAAGAQLAQAHPILVDDRRGPPLLVDRKPPPPPPPPAEPLHTRLGLRVGGGAFPLDGRDVTGISVLQLSADVELATRTRGFAEYALQIVTPRRSAAMDSPFDTIDHRFDLGMSVEALVKDVNDVHLAATLEGGGGVDLISGMLGPHRVPHAFVGVRASFEVHPDHLAKPPPTFGFELLARAVIVPDGAGMLFGIGLLWGR